jgi:hypothetical protein
MMGGLHIEMAAFRTLGDWLKGSGWITAITNAGIASSGVAESFLKASHLARIRHAHLTAAALYILFFVVARKSKRKYSAIALDHAHEQCNAQIKYDGGSVGLTSNPSALHRWMLAGLPEW